MHVTVWSGASKAARSGEHSTSEIGGGGLSRLYSVSPAGSSYWIVSVSVVIVTGSSDVLVTVIL